MFACVKKMPIFNSLAIHDSMNPAPNELFDQKIKIASTTVYKLQIMVDSDDNSEVTRPKFVLAF